MARLCLAGLVLCCKEWQPGWVPLLQGELSFLARVTGQVMLSLLSYNCILLSLYSSLTVGCAVEQCLVYCTYFLVF